MKVKLVKAKTFQLDPKKKYIMVFDKHAISQEDVEKLGEMIHKQFWIDTIAVMTELPDSLKVVEIQESDTIDS